MNEYTLDIVCTGPNNRKTGSRGHPPVSLGQVKLSHARQDDASWHQWPVDGVGFIGFPGLRYLHGNSLVEQSFVQPRWRGGDYTDGFAVRCPTCGDKYAKRGDKLPATELNGEHATALILALREQGVKELDIGPIDLAHLAAKALKIRNRT